MSHLSPLSHRNCPLNIINKAMNYFLCPVPTAAADLASRRKPSCLVGSPGRRCYACLVYRWSRTADDNAPAPFLMLFVLFFRTATGLPTVNVSIYWGFINCMQLPHVCVYVCVCAISWVICWRANWVQFSLTRVSIISCVHARIIGIV